MSGMGTRGRGRINGAVLEPEQAVEQTRAIAGAGAPPEPERMLEEVVRLPLVGPLLHGKPQYEGFWVEMAADPPSGDIDALAAARTNGDRRDCLIPLITDWNLRDRKGARIELNDLAGQRLSYRLVDAIIAAYGAYLASLQAPVPNSDDGSNAT